MSFKTIGILTSGGDCPGMNALIISAYRAAKKRGVRLIGIKRGFAGLLDGDFIEITDQHIHLAYSGGTFIYTSRGDGGVRERLLDCDIKALLHSNGLDSLIVAGGEGSLSAIAKTAGNGIPVVGVPATIDNDVFGTDYSLGFDTACNMVVRVSAEIADTGSSLSGRIFVIETLGGYSGHIALASAYAIGADAVLVPEVEPNLEHICAKLKNVMDGGKPYGLVVAGEGVTNLAEIEQKIPLITGNRTRITSLGHAQRGGRPTFFDMELARSFAEEAVVLAASNICGRYVVKRGDKIDSNELSGCINLQKPLNLEMYCELNGIKKEQIKQ